MKKLSFLIVILLVATQVFGQSKRELLDEIIWLKTDTSLLNKQLDSISNEVAAQLIIIDSVQTEKELYYGVYATIKEEVIMYDFDPAKTSFLIDSLKASRDSTYAFLMGSAAQLQDTITFLENSNLVLQARIDSLLQVPPNKDDMMKELKQLKELQEGGIINEELFNSKRDMIMEKWK